MLNTGVREQRRIRGTIGTTVGSIVKGPALTLCSTGSVSVLLTGVHERKEFLIERLTSLEANEGSGQQFSQWPEEAR